MDEVQEIQEMKEKCIALIMEGIISDSVEHGCGAMSLVASIAERAKVAIRNKDMSFLAYKAVKDEINAIANDK